MAYTASTGKIYNSMDDYLKELGAVPNDQGILQFPDVSSVSSENISDVSPLNYKEPDDTPIFDPSALSLYEPPEYELTKPEEEAQGFYKQIQDINKMLGEEPGYKAEKEKEYDIEGLTKSQQDLSNQLRLLQAEYQQIPLQIQQEYEGRGATAAGVAPVEASRLRKLSIRALGVSALSEAAQGNLATAQSLVDRAVSQKFDPLKAEKAVLIENLQLIQSSPEYTLADKKRAAEQEAYQNALKTQIEEAEEEYKAIQSIALEAAKSGNIDALTLQNIQNAGSREEALRMALEAGVYEEKDVMPEMRTVGKTLLQYNPETGGWDVAYREPESSKEYDVKLSSSDKNRLLGAGFTLSQIDQIEKDVAQHGLNDVIGETVEIGKWGFENITTSGLSASQAQALRDVFSGITPTQVKNREEEEAEQMEKTWEDQEVKEYILEQLKSKTSVSSIKGFIRDEKTMTEADKENAIKILEEYVSPGLQKKMEDKPEEYVITKDGIFHSGSWLPFDKKIVSFK